MAGRGNRDCGDPVTFSLIGRCDRTAMLGAVVASSSPAVAARCPWARARVGAACTQNLTDPTLGPALLDRLVTGGSAEQALADLVATAPHVEYRQLTVVDARGGAATFSGEQTLGRHGASTESGCAAAGNLLAREEVPRAMVEAFRAEPAAHLGDRLFASLRAGRDAGGEEGQVHSSGIVVADRVPWYVVDLRVDWRDDDPIEELGRLWKLWKPQVDDYVSRALDPASAPSFGVPGDK
jgi:uncharacterized Ntn-hydrolase superfamily protein